jgi:hypothetical protein
MSVGAATTAIEAHRAECDALVRRAREHAGDGDRERAATLLQAAAMSAWFHHTGAFADAGIEDLVEDLGRSLGSPRTTARTAGTLHVATQVYPTGGSTQAIVGWTERDAGRHALCLTRQGRTPLPDKVRAVAWSGLTRLDRRPGRLLRRAAHLRRLAAGADVVVLHPHPYDIVPALAFADRRGMPPVLYVDHADHVFWVGVRSADLFVHMRDSGVRMGQMRRGLAPSSSAVLARPLRIRTRTTERAQARAALGVPPGDLLVVTAADGSKYRGVQADGMSVPGLLDVLRGVVADTPGITVLAAGPAPEGEWTAAETATGGRIRALGRLPDTAALFQAADVYLDSFPFSSLTSMLEAGMMGTPVVTYRGLPESCAVLGADTRGLDDVIRRPGTPAELAGALRNLRDDTGNRRREGERVAAAIAATHDGDAWRAAYADALTAARRNRTHGVPAVPPPPRHDEIDVLVDLVMRQTGHPGGARAALREHAGLLPFRDRLALLRADPAGGAAVLAPEWVRSRAPRRPGSGRQR